MCCINDIAHQLRQSTTTGTRSYERLTSRRLRQLLRAILQGPLGVRPDRLRVQPHGKAHSLSLASWITMGRVTSTSSSTSISIHVGGVG